MTGTRTNSRDNRILSLLSDARMRGVWYRVNCPFCEERVGKEDRDRTLSVHSESGGFRCFRCNVHGKVTLPDAYVIERPVKTEATEVEPPDGFTPLGIDPGLTALSLAPARAYLASRGIPSRTIAEAGIGACAVGPYAGRVVVPVYDLDGVTWLGFSSRVWTKKCDPRMKYRNAKGDWRGTTIFNPGALFRETDEPCFVVEGVFDALAPGLWPDAVAVLGDATDAQVAMLACARRPLAVVLDGDAHRKAWALAERLKFEGVRAESIRLAPQQDPDDVPPGVLREQARALLAQGD